MKTQTVEMSRFIVQVETYDMGAWSEGYKRRVEAVSAAAAMAKIPTTECRRPAWAVNENDHH